MHFFETYYALLLYVYYAYPAAPAYHEYVSIIVTNLEKRRRVFLLIDTIPFEWQPPMPYDFAYVVKDELSYNDFGHQETSDGKTVTGSCRVVLPDTRTQIVNYKIDGYSGYVVDVEYEGEAKFPEYKPAYKPAYPATKYSASF